MTFRSHGMRSPTALQPLRVTQSLMFKRVSIKDYNISAQGKSPSRSMTMDTWAPRSAYGCRLYSCKSSFNLLEFRWTLQMLPWKLFQIQTGRVQRHCWGSLLCARRWKQKWVSPKFLQSLVTCNTTDLTDLYDKRKKEVPPCSIH